MTERTLLQQYVQIAVVVAAYWFISITLGEFENVMATPNFLIDFFHLSYILVFVNKSLLSGSTKLDAPLFVTW